MAGRLGNRKRPNVPVHDTNVKTDDSAVAIDVFPVVVAAVDEARDTRIDATDVEADHHLVAVAIAHLEQVLHFKVGYTAPAAYVADAVPRAVLQGRPRVLNAEDRAALNVKRKRGGQVRPEGAIRQQLVDFHLAGCRRRRQVAVERQPGDVLLRPPQATLIRRDSAQKARWNHARIWIARDTVTLVFTAGVGASDRGQHLARTADTTSSCGRLSTARNLVTGQVIAHVDPICSDATLRVT